MTERIKPTPAKLIELADKHIREGRWSKAEDCVSKALAANAKRPRWFVRRAQVRVVLRDISGAIDDYRNALGFQEEPAWRAALSELIRAPMPDGKPFEASSSYYDDCYTTLEKYSQASELPLYAPMWLRISDLIGIYDKKDIIDIGCGTGQFAQFLHHRIGWNSFLGLDFSQQAIKISNSRNLPAEFRVSNALKSDFDDAGAAYVCTEVLEHIRADLRMLRRLPPGAVAMCSVPSFQAFGHVRIFATASSVRKRYGRLFESLQVESFELAAGRSLFLFHGALRQMDH